MPAHIYGLRFIYFFFLFFAIKKTTSSSVESIKYLGRQIFVRHERTITIINLTNLQIPPATYEYLKRRQAKRINARKNVYENFFALF